MTYENHRPTADLRSGLDRPHAGWCGGGQAVPDHRAGQHRGSGTRRPSRDAPRFPAILDTGNNHNFAIRQAHLERWAPMILPEAGRVEIGTFIIPLLAANVWIHPNRPGRSIRAGNRRSAWSCSAASSSIRRTFPIPPGCPILGLRGLIRNSLRLTIDGDGPESDPRIPFRLSPIAFHPTPTTVTSGSQMRTLDKPAMDRRLHPWD